MKKILTIILVLFLPMVALMVAPMVAFAGIDAADGKVINVADGTESTDGINYQQLLDYAAAGGHNMLSIAHGDTTTDTITRGSLIYGNSTPAWDELILGTSGYFLRSDGTDIAWSPTTNITALGTIATGVWNAGAITSSGAITGTSFVTNSGDANIGGDAFITGDVGIGTAFPDSAFHIKANTSGIVGSHHAGQIIIQNPTDTVFSNVVITGYESDGSGNPDQQLWYLGSSSVSNSDITFLNRRNAKLTLGTSGTSRITILGNGDVGIGETAPQDKLEVNGTVLVKDKLKFTQDDGNEYIDSLNDGYMDYGATTGHRFNANVDITGTVVIASDAPSSSTDTGTAGTITWDSTYLYVCTSTDTWKRAALSSWGVTGDVLLETGDILLLETGDALLLES